MRHCHSISSTRMQAQAHAAAGAWCAFRSNQIFDSIIFGIDFALPLDQIMVSSFSSLCSRSEHRLTGYSVLIFGIPGATLCKFWINSINNFVRRTFGGSKNVHFLHPRSTIAESMYIIQYCEFKNHLKFLRSLKMFTSLPLPACLRARVPIPHCMATAAAATQCSSFTWPNICCLFMPTDNTKHILSPYLRSDRTFVLRLLAQIATG